MQLDSAEGMHQQLVMDMLAACVLVFALHLFGYNTCNQKPCGVTRRGCLIPGGVCPRRYTSSLHVHDKPDCATSLSTLSCTVDLDHSRPCPQQALSTADHVHSRSCPQQTMSTADHVHACFIVEYLLAQR